MSRPRVRIRSNEDVVRNATVVQVVEDADGVEIEYDISPNVRGVDMRLRVGEIATAGLDLILVDTDVDAFVEGITLQVVPPERIPEVIEELKRRFTEAVEEGVIDVTTFGADCRRYMLVKEAAE